MKFSINDRCRSNTDGTIEREYGSVIGIVLSSICGGVLGEKGSDRGYIIFGRLARIKLFGEIESVVMRVVGVEKTGGGRCTGELLL